MLTEEKFIEGTREELIEYFTNKLSTPTTLYQRGSKYLVRDIKTCLNEHCNGVLGKMPYYELDENDSLNVKYELFKIKGMTNESLILGWFMGAVYRRKRRSCPLCKPNKTGRAPARSYKEQQILKAMQKEIKENERK